MKRTAADHFVSENLSVNRSTVRSDSARSRHKITEKDGIGLWSAERSSSKVEIFQCQNPCTKRMETTNARVKTFINGWPKHIRATAKELASAGFYFLGKYDQVKCYYCNGGLQNWHYNDNPWFEHAKWYPHCEYLLNKKGIDFVEKVASQYPDIMRPFDVDKSGIHQTAALHASAPAEFQQQYVISDKAGNRPCSSVSSNLCTLSYVQATMGTEVVREAVNLGFDRTLVEKLLQTKLSSSKKGYDSLVELVSDLQQFQDNEENRMKISDDDHTSCETRNTCLSGKSQSFSGFSENRSTLQCASATVLLPASPGSKKLVCKKQFDKRTDMTVENTPSYDDEDLHLEAKIEKLQQEHMCKVCLDRDSNCLFLSCRHICCCRDCGSCLKFCPICRKKIDSAVVIYRS